MIVKLILECFASIGASVLVARLDQSQGKQGYLPTGSIWLLSSLVYGGIGVWGRHISKTSFLSEYHLTAEDLTTTACEIYSLSVIFFALGYCMTVKIIENSYIATRFSADGPIKALAKSVDLSRLVFCLFTILIGNLLWIQFLDLGDRYNSYPALSWIGRISNSLSTVSTLGPIAFFTLGVNNQSFKLYPTYKYFRKRARRLQVLNLALAASAIILFTKMGSRSYLLSLALAVLLGYLISTRSRTAKLRSFGLIIIFLLAFVPFSETLRIARSDSTFYKANPTSFIHLIGASFVFKPSGNQLLTQVNRHPLDEVIYAKGSYCASEIASAGKGEDAHAKKARSNEAYLKQLELCRDHEEQMIGHKHWPSLTTLANEIRGGNSRSLFSSQNYLEKLYLKQGKSPDSALYRELPSLRAEVFQRYGLLGVATTFSVIGILYGYYNTLIDNVYARRFLLAKYLSALLPLTLLTGGLSLPLLSHTWLFFLQFPKQLILTWLIAFIIMQVDSRIFNGGMNGCA